MEGWYDDGNKPRAIAETPPTAVVISGIQVPFRFGTSALAMSSEYSPDRQAGSVVSGSQPTRAVDLVLSDWLCAPSTQTIFSTVEKGGFAIRAVGGAVRNALIGAPIGDIDFATPARPETVMALARENGLHAHPTGIEHGTVTLVSDGVPFEVTTLRKDVETHGRRAVVAYTDDWREDALRRDFTINALYCDKDGVIHDPLGTGLSDIAMRRLAFIGSARDRIEEDYLRILRYFRFLAHYRVRPADETIGDTVQQTRQGLLILSAERVHHELSKIAAGPFLIAAARGMAETGVLEVLFGDGNWTKRIAAVEKIMAIEEQSAALRRVVPQRGLALLKLSALAGLGFEAGTEFADTFRMSGEERALIRSRLGPSPETFALPLSGSAIDALLHRLGRRDFAMALIWSWALGPDPADCTWRHSALRRAERWVVKPFPINGADVLAMDVPAGPAIGRLLKQLEAFWVANGFIDDERALRAKLAELVAAERTKH